MKKVMSIFLVGLMLLVSAHTALAAEDTLDIEKVAIQTLKTSQQLQSADRQVTEVQKNYQDMLGMASILRGTLQYSNSYSTIESVILNPAKMKVMVTQVTNAKVVLSNYIRLSSYQAYISLLKASYAENIQQGLMNDLAADYKTAQQQESLGLISPSQLRLTQISYLQAQYAYDSAKKAFNSASMQVNNLMGEDITKQFSSLQDYNIVPAGQIKSLDAYIGLALANRLEIADDQSQLDIDKEAFEYGKSAMPTDYDLYCQQEQQTLDNDQNALDLDKLKVQKNITETYSSLQGAMKAMQAQKDLDDQAASNYQSAEIQYKNSMITLQDFDKAKVAKAQADMNYKNSQMDAWLAQTMMGLASGAGYVPFTLNLTSTSSHVNKLLPSNPIHDNH
ncbi:outer membrane efflux protein [Desulfosporosinus acididurans]|uniref:Outer membrane efflux protein n=1 Tax=Desulfosporosinus acididurans TaxID=476652 RepID=A0A0J1II35_9FIRM|nr:TolC family protein [Desulfosporosinus acididurans]KLU64351.1 outer membrane efflux protein [Desulfosporosinus acididurans]